MSLLKERSSHFITFLFAIALFVSAFLLFWVELMFAKMILPLLGGSPAVWNTCLVFFQTTLLLGYSYVHWMTRQSKVQHQTLIQAGLLLLPLPLLPIHLFSTSAPPQDANPIPWLLGLLALSAGLPFFAVSTFAPLLQQWLSQIQPKKDPYILYAASNAGSLLSLIAYPTWLESHFSLNLQSLLWSCGYGLLVCLVFGCIFFVRRDTSVSPAGSPATIPSTHSPDSISPPSWREQLTWIGLAAAPSSLMLGVTTHVTTDIAPIPLLWAIPLGIYLLTFILVFAPKPFLVTESLVAGLPFGVILIIYVMTFVGPLAAKELLQIHLIAFILLAWACHGELSQRRPELQYLTTFYLCLSIGGVLGGWFNTLVAPVLFKNLLEYPLALVFTLFLLPLPSSRSLKRFFQIQLVSAVILLVVGIVYQHTSVEALTKERSFFGIYEVLKRNDHVSLIHGTTVHGVQSLDPVRKLEPSTYFSRSSPIGQLFESLPQRPSRVAVLGLGAGTIAAYGEPGQQWTFYEIDSLVEKLSRQYFTFLSSSKAAVSVSLGDGRRSLAASSTLFDLIVLDAFSSDAVPVHLLTREALEIYLSKLSPNGVLAFNITNRYLDLGPVLSSLAHSLDLVVLERKDVDLSLADRLAGKSASVWVVLVRQDTALKKLSADSRWFVPQQSPHLWTDNFSNLLGTFRRSE